jgi:hypothetical protein
MLIFLTGGIYECAVEFGSGAMIYVSGFIKIGSGIQKLMGRHMRPHRHTHTHTHTHTRARSQNGDLISLLLIF